MYISRENRHDFTPGARLNRGIADYFAAMPESKMRAVAPSVFADQAHDSRSAKYQYIPTIDIVNALIREGFTPVSAQQCRSRDASRKEHTKHLIKFSRRDVATVKVGDSIPQVCLVNSHDGTSAYKLYVGLFRFICSNGAIVCDGTFDSFSVPHMGDIQQKVIEGSYRVIDAAKNVGDRVQDWRALTLDGTEQMAFARAAHQLRFDDKIPAGEATPIQPRDLLEEKRPDDRGADLWKTFNRIQENVIKGGQHYRLPPAKGQWRDRRMEVKPVQGIDQNTALNRALWRLADELKRIKTGEAIAA